MKKLDRMEMMTLRIALEGETRKLERLWKAATDPHAEAGFRIRLERAENLLSLCQPGTTITVGV